MNLPIITLIAVSVLPIMWGWVSGYYRHSQLGEVDNKQPRQQNEKLVDAGQRAVAAQYNAWEALAVYIAALVAVNTAGVAVEQYATLTAIFLACRVVHGVAYVINQDILRSLAFLAGYGICIYMMIMAL